MGNLVGGLRSVVNVIQVLLINYCFGCKKLRCLDVRTVTPVYFRSACHLRVTPIKQMEAFGHGRTTDEAVCHAI